MNTKQSHARLTTLVAVIAALAVSATGCARKRAGWTGIYALSSGEQATIEANPFSPELQMTSVEGEATGTIGTDSLDPDNEASEAVRFINHCDPSMYEKELKDAMTAAAADADRKTIVVRYSYSFGTPMDHVAHLAYQRSILRKTDDGITPVPVGAANDLNAYSSAPHYYGDHRVAREDYVSGRKCYFSTMKVVGTRSGPVMMLNGTIQHDLPDSNPADFAYDHAQALLYYGDDYTCDTDCTRRYLSPRLFKSVEGGAVDIRAMLDRYEHDNLTNLKLSEFIRQCQTPTQPQIIPLFVADLREKRIGIPDIYGQFIDPAFASSAIRRYEYEVKLKKILHLNTLWANFSRIDDAFRVDRTIPDPDGGPAMLFQGYDGAGQLLSNLVFSGLNGIVASTQYTPIVLDLGSRHIRTSSLRYGTFFNLANVRYRLPLTGAEEKAGGRLPADEGRMLGDIHHLTAWVGGEVTPLAPPARQRLVASDGFLVVPEVVDPTGCGGQPRYAVPRGATLFGSYMDAGGGRLSTYDHGFAKLRAWINSHGTANPKTCALNGVTDAGVVEVGGNGSTDTITRLARSMAALSSAQIKARYLGPWDGAAFGDLRVWVDANRDGLVECGEMKTLAESGVLALNTCNLNYQVRENGDLVPMSDRFGNRTHLRAAFLAKPEGASLDEDEMIRRIRSGKTSTGADVEFRVAIDILFKTEEGTFLEDVRDEDIRRPTLATPGAGTDTGWTTGHSLPTTPVGVSERTSSENEKNGAGK